MPIASGAKGRMSILASPTERIGVGRSFRSPRFSMTSIRVTGITKNSTGTPLGNCDVHLFRAADDAEVDQGVSDGAGNYSLICAGSGTFYIVAYKAGSPDVAGTTVNTLIGS